MVLWDHGAFVPKQALDPTEEWNTFLGGWVGGGGGGVGEGRHSLMWLIQVRYVLLNTRS